MTKWIPNLTRLAEPSSNNQANTARAKYLVIADAIAEAMTNGQLVPGERLPTHRALADQLGVTVGTITRAYTEAERRGLVHARVGSGTFIKGGEDEPALFKIHEQPADGLINLSLNLPVNTNRANYLADAFQALGNQPTLVNQLLGYQPDRGMPHHRQSLANWSSKMGFKADADNLVITNGAQHGIMVSLFALARAGDTILAEGLTYTGLMAIARHLNLKVQAIAMDDQGILPEALEQACQQYKAKLLYCTPSLQNPTNAIMSLERREQLLAVAKRFGLIILEDDIQGVLLSNPPPCLASLAPEQVVYISSLSKSLAAGLRVGYVVAPDAYKDQIATAVRANCWMVSPLIVELAHRWIESGLGQEVVDKQRQELYRRHQLLTHDLSADYQLYSHPDSLHAMLMLPEHWRSDPFITRLKQQGVSVLNIEQFAVGHYPAPQAIRISLGSAENYSQFQQGIAIVAQLLSQTTLSESGII